MLQVPFLEMYKRQKTTKGSKILGETRKQKSNLRVEGVASCSYIATEKTIISMFGHYIIRPIISSGVLFFNSTQSWHQKEFKFALQDNTA